MRISSAVLGLAFIAGMVSPAFAAESPFLGKWTATAAAPGGDTAEIVTAAKTRDGYTVTAKLVAPKPGQLEAGPGKDIVLDGDHFSFKRTLTIGTSELVFTYSGVVSGDKFTGTIDVGGLAKVAFTGVRAKDGG